MKSKPTFCSPDISSSIAKNTCFSLSQLKILVKQYNKHFPDKIKLNSKSSSNTILSTLNSKLKPLIGDNNQHLWPDYLLSLSPNYELEHISETALVPKKPESWKKNPNTWLTNFDIDAILDKYDNATKYQYKYLGTKPIDFAEINQNQCSFDQNCRINIKDIISENKKFMGLILNLDRHNESGSHWVSLFFCIDPTLKSYGIYYYDSYSGKMPKIVCQYITDIQKQLYKIYKKKPDFYTNNVRHQYGNSECGMFSICYQIRWLNYLKKNKNATFKDIIHVKINDKIMTDIRNILFRPHHEF